MTPIRPLHKRWAEKVEWTPTCWLWIGYIAPDGYGRLSSGPKGVPLLAHRAAYLIHRGNAAAGLTLDHLCRNRRCVNPWHLEAITNKENILRGIAFSAQNAKKTHCPRGHAYDALNTMIARDGSRNCRSCRRARPVDPVARNARRRLLYRLRRAA